MKKLILFLLILAISVITYFLVFNQQPKSKISKPTLVEKKEEIILPTSNPSPTSEVYQCDVDENCVLVPVGNCCDYVAVNENFRDEIKSTSKICMRECYMRATCNRDICQVKSSK